VYSIVYLCHGRLPWQDISTEGPNEQYEAAVLKKKTAVAETLCQGLPLPFIMFTQHIQLLGFDKKPQYDHLHTLLTQCLALASDGVVSNPITVAISPSLCKHSVATPLPHK
jgi:hypothetical protein